MRIRTHQHVAPESAVKHRVNFRRDRIQVSLSGLNKLRVRDKTFPAPINSINARGARCHFDPVEVEHLVEPWVEDVIEPIIYGDACRCIAEHRQRGDRILIISASGTHLVGPIAARLGVDEYLAIELEAVNGVYTGKTHGVLTYREGKITRLLEWLDQEQENLEGASFYSDSRNDLPLLLKVDHPHVVNPDAVLREHAQTNGWPILSWS